MKIEEKFSHHFKKRIFPVQVLFAGAIPKSPMSRENFQNNRMKKIMITVALFLFGITAFSQQEINGIIYIKHPYIDVVNNAVKNYATGNFTDLKKSYADSATYWQDGMEKFAPFENAIKGWNEDRNFLSDISMTPIGYPDYLQYKKENAKIVQSWWTWSAKSRKSGEVIKVLKVLYDEFNSDGKIIKQYMIGDFSKLRLDRMLNREYCCQQFKSWQQCHLNYKKKSINEQITFF